MGIDGINKPGADAPTPGASGAGSSEGFQDRLEASTSGAEVGKVGSSALERLHAGELSVDEYLDLQVEQAVVHLQGRLPEDQLSFVRESLRAQLSEDPVLVELVRQTVGSAGTPR